MNRNTYNNHTKGETSYIIYDDKSRINNYQSRKRNTRSSGERDLSYHIIYYNLHTTQNTRSSGEAVKQNKQTIYY